MKPKKWVADNTEEKPKLKVAAYCRVSTEMEEQASSYEAQVQHYTDYIQKNPDWELAGIFADEGISGTDTKKRAEFNRMIDACKNGEIEYIITKSISRFARNTVDCLQYIRKLKELKIAVFFEKENINTMDAKGEVLLTIMASLAQQESQSLSQNTKMGVHIAFNKDSLESTIIISSVTQKMRMVTWWLSLKNLKSLNAFSENTLKGVPCRILRKD
ncbi:TPA: recombinase family protein [Streptococcus suis]